MIRHLLCASCRTAWTATNAPTPALDYCHGVAPVECAPQSSDARAWFDAAVTGWRAAQVSQVANFSGRGELHVMLGRGVLRRGRDWTVAS